MNMSRDKLAHEVGVIESGSLSRGLHIVRLMGSLQDHLVQVEEQQPRWYWDNQKRVDHKETVHVEELSDEHQLETDLHAVQYGHEADVGDHYSGDEDDDDEQSWIEDITSYSSGTPSIDRLEGEDDMPTLSRMTTMSPPPLYHSFDEDSEDFSETLSETQSESEDDEFEAKRSFAMHYGTNSHLFDNLGEKDTPWTMNVPRIEDGIGVH